DGITTIESITKIYSRKCGLRPERPSRDQKIDYQRGGGKKPACSRALGRSQRSSRFQRLRTIRRATATPLYCARARGRAGGRSHGRTVQCARSDCDGEGGRTHLPVAREFYDRNCNA